MKTKQVPPDFKRGRKNGREAGREGKEEGGRRPKRKTSGNVITSPDLEGGRLRENR